MTAQARRFFFASKKVHPILFQFTSKFEKKKRFRDRDKKKEHVGKDTEREREKGQNERKKNCNRKIMPTKTTRDKE